MPIVLLFVGVYVLGVVGASYGLVRLVSRWFPRVRVLAATLALVFCGLALTPVPIHGGFVFLLPELISESLGELQRSRAARAREQKEKRLASRFAGHLPVAHHRDGWRDPESGLVWSEALEPAAAIDASALAAAKAQCAAREPRGYWAVPRDADFYFLAKAGRAEGAWLAEAYLWPEEVSLPVRVRFAGGGAARTSCVAVTPPAPARGYLSSDVPLEDWNRYQLALASGSAAADPSSRE